MLLLLKTAVLAAFRVAVSWVSLPILLVGAVIARRKKKDCLIWTPIPIINNKYWALAMREVGWNTKTLMANFYSIHRREDYDLYFSDLAPWLKHPLLRVALEPLLAHWYIMRNAVVVHLPFSGGPLSTTDIWWAEAFFYRRAGVRAVVVPYGADIYRYSTVPDPAVRHALLLSYPAAAKRESVVGRHVRYWIENADLIMVGHALDGIGRWDIPSGNIVCVDVRQWSAKKSYSSCDGKNGAVRVLHTPNHRGAKGTEFLLFAVDWLRSEGYAVDLILLERVQNERVREEMQSADILADQFVLPGYGMAAIEALASGLPVMANLDDEHYTRMFRRYSFLDECPVVSTTPETITSTLRALVSNPELRRVLGMAGRAFAEKYHSYAMAQYLFGAIYRKLLQSEDVDLANLFHPLRSVYSRGSDRIAHPLVDNRLPARYLQQDGADA